VSLILGHGVLRHKWLDCDKTWSPGERASRMCSRSRSRARDLYDFTASVGLFNLGLILFCRPQLWRQCGRDFRKQKKNITARSSLDVGQLNVPIRQHLNQSNLCAVLGAWSTVGHWLHHISTGSVCWKMLWKKLVFTMLLKTFEKSKFYFRFFVRFYTYYVI